MFRNGVMDQNVKRSLTFAFFWSKSDPDQPMPSSVSNRLSVSKNSRNEGLYTKSYSWCRSYIWLFWAVSAYNETLEIIMANYTFLEPFWSDEHDERPLNLVGSIGWICRPHVLYRLFWIQNGSHLCNKRKHGNNSILVQWGIKFPESIQN